MREAIGWERDGAPRRRAVEPREGHRVAVYLDDHLGMRAREPTSGERSGGDERVGGDDHVWLERAQSARCLRNERRIEERRGIRQCGESLVASGTRDGRQDAYVQLLADGVPLLREPGVERDGDAAATDEERPGSQRAASARIASSRA